jgi:hypothetical protein
MKLPLPKMNTRNWPKSFRMTGRLKPQLKWLNSKPALPTLLQTLRNYYLLNTISLIVLLSFFLNVFRTGDEASKTGKSEAASSTTASATYTGAGAGAAYDGAAGYQGYQGQAGYQGYNYPGWGGYQYPAGAGGWGQQGYAYPQQGYGQQ